MIHGIGCDLVEIARIEKLYKRFGERMLKRIYTETEREQMQHQLSPIPRMAKYFAAKEAAFKALGVGHDLGISWQDFEVGYVPGGQPALRIYGAANGILPQTTRCHLSLSDSETHALAYVVIEAA